MGVIVRSNQISRGIPMRSLLLITALVVVGCGKRTGSDSQSGKSDEPESFTDSWTHKDVAAFLAKKGIKVEINPFSRGVDMEAYAFFDGNSDVIVYQYKSRQVAAEQASSIGKAAFSKGRFAFGIDLKATEAKRKLDAQFLSRLKTILVDQ
jgi:hypothetical protein